MNIEKIYNLAVSDKVADRKKAQRMLKALDLYKGPIDGEIGLGSMRAISKLRAQAKADKEADRKAEALEAENKLSQKKLELQLKKNEQESKELDNKLANDAYWRSMYQSAGFAISAGFGAFAGHKIEKVITAKDAAAIKAKNKALRDTVKEVNATMKTTARTKSGDFKAPVKKQLGAIVTKANSRGITVHKYPRGWGVAAFLLADSLVLRGLAETSGKDNPEVRSGLHTVATGLQFASMAIPGFRSINIASTPHQLDGQAISKIARAGAIAVVKPKIKPKVSLGRFLKVGGALGVGVALGFAAKKLYDDYQKSNKKTAKPLKDITPKKTSSVAKDVVRGKIAAGAKAPAQIEQKITRAPAKAKAGPKGYREGYYRRSKNGKKHWVRGHKLTA